MVSVFFGAAVKGQYREDLLGSLLPTTVSQNEPKISPRGVEMSQLNATLNAELVTGCVYLIRTLDNSTSSLVNVAKESREICARN